MIIAAPACPTITLEPTSLLLAITDLEYSQTLTASGGSDPYSFTLISGALPEGLSLSGTGMISGIPTESRTFSFVIRVTNNQGCQGTQAYTLIVDVPSQRGK